MKSRVLILSNKLPYPSDDGSSIAMARLLETLAMKELDLHYYAINTDKHSKDVEVSRAHQPNVTFEAFAWNTSPKVSTALGNLATICLTTLVAFTSLRSYNDLKHSIPIVSIQLFWKGHSWACM
jgi:hypothetical protein